MALHRWLAALFITLSLVVLPRAAAAQSDADKATARTLAQEGQVALDKGDFKQAEDRFRRADALYHVPSLALGLAQSQVGLKRLVAAQETYKAIVREGVPSGLSPKASAAMASAVQDAKKELAALEPRIPAVVFTVDGPSDPKLRLDGAALSSAVLGVRRPIDPGEHLFQVTADGWKPRETKFSINEGQTQNVRLTLEAGAPPPAPPPPVQPMPIVPAPIGQTPGGSDRAPSKGGGWMKPLGITATVIGSVALATGIGTGIVAIAQHSILETDCFGGVCDRSDQDTLDSFHTFSTISTIGFVVGVAGLGAGITLIAVAPSKNSGGVNGGPAHAKRTAPKVEPYLGLGKAGLMGSF